MDASISPESRELPKPFRLDVPAITRNSQFRQAIAERTSELIQAERSRIPHNTPLNYYYLYVDLNGEFSYTNEIDDIGGGTSVGHLTIDRATEPRNRFESWFSDAQILEGSDEEPINPIEMII